MFIDIGTGFSRHISHVDGGHMAVLSDVVDSVVTDDMLSCRQCLCPKSSSGFALLHSSQKLNIHRRTSDSTAVPLLLRILRGRQSVRPDCNRVEALYAQQCRLILSPFVFRSQNFAALLRFSGPASAASQVYISNITIGNN